MCLYSDFDKYKCVKTDREQTSILLENLVLKAVIFISSVLGFGLCTYAL